MDGGHLGCFGSDVTGVEREGGRVRVGGVQAERYQKACGCGHGGGGGLRERIFIWAVGEVSGMLTQTTVSWLTSWVLSPRLYWKKEPPHRKRDQEDERGSGECQWESGWWELFGGSPFKRTLERLDLFKQLYLKSRFSSFKGNL